MGFDRGDSFPFDFETNGIPFGSKSKGKLTPRSYPIQCERKWKYSFLSVDRVPSRDPRRFRSKYKFRGLKSFLGNFRDFYLETQLFWCNSRVIYKSAKILFFRTFYNLFFILSLLFLKSCLFITPGIPRILK